MTEQTVASLAALVDGRVIGDSSRTIVGVCDLRAAAPDRVGFVRDAKYRDSAKASKAGALITPFSLDTEVTQIVVEDVAIAFAKVAAVLHPPPRATRHRVDPTAIVHPEARLIEPVELGPRVVVGRAEIGPGSVLMAGVVIADGVRIGRDCVFHPNVTIYSGVQIGDRVMVHSGSVLGSDGFGYAREGATWLKVPQLGTVEIGEDVEIGANCAIDRGTMGSTIIGPRTKIDNLCHIAHNVRVGCDNALAAASLVAGSTVLGDRVTLGGHVIVAGHIRLADDVRVGGGSTLLHGIHRSGDYMGYPPVEKRHWLRHLREFRKALRQDDRPRAPSGDDDGDDAGLGDA